MAADRIIYCLENLTDYAQFEWMCHDLMALEDSPGIEPLGGFKGKDCNDVHVSHDAEERNSVFAYSFRDDWEKRLDEARKR